ncbi:uncharacterized protein LOC143059524 [Mytilus galloprovincialis]|uniref:Band 7 domain-containing protein n=1 Tax=Mytilus galloprovincialis TaxID=29158 RepID=A0A8B6FG62_MYTGA|nr:Hypothetical predicted protein [Mytilus galloprovincialis]
MSDDSACLFKVVAGAAVVGIGLLVILLPMSFHGLNYYEMGFKRQKSTGTVKLDKTYESGLHLIGPDFEFKVFPADSHDVNLYNIKAFTSDKLEVKVSVSFQYFLRSYELADLHNKFNMDYEDVMRSKAIDALKGAIPVYNTREVVKKRKEIEEVIYKAIRERLGGICCAPQEYCKSWKFACPLNCKSRDICNDDDKGVYVDVKYFQLGSIRIPHTVEERFLRQLVLQEETDREKLLQGAQIVRKQTDFEVRVIKNKALELSEQAESTSRLLHVTAAANYTSEVEGARSIGLTKLYNNLGITKQEHKNSFDYLRTLRGMDNIWLTVDYQQKIMGNLGSR